MKLKKKKPTFQFIKPYQFSKKISCVAYQIFLPHFLFNVQNVFLVSLKKI